MQDHYQILGLTKENFSEDALKKAYKKKAMDEHPDRKPPEERKAAEAKIKQINEAYDTLKNEQKRNKYDNPHSGGFSFSQGSDGFRVYTSSANSPDIMDQLRRDFGVHFNFSEPDEDLFSIFRTGPRRQANRNISIRMQVTLEEAFTGKQQTIHVPNGSSNKLVNVKIPRSVMHGQKIRFKGFGENINTTLQPGDLIINIFIQPSQIFVRQGPHLSTEIEIDSFDAMLGKDVEIITIEGKKLSVVVPIGAQTGSVARIQGHGMYANPTGSARGDLLLHFNVNTPNLTDEQKELVEKARDLKQ